MDDFEPLDESPVFKNVPLENEQTNQVSDCTISLGKIQENPLTPSFLQWKQMAPANMQAFVAPLEDWFATSILSIQGRGLSNKEIFWFSQGVFSQLEQLDLSDNPIGESINFLKDLQAPRLSRLYLNRTNIDDKAFLSFFETFGVERLGVLEISGNPISGSSFTESLTLHPSYALRFLSLDAPEDVPALDNGSLALIFKNITFPKLNHLSLSGQILSKDDVEALACASLPQLSYLCLDHTSIAPNALISLKNVSWGENLKNLSLSGIKEFLSQESSDPLLGFLSNPIFASLEYLNVANLSLHDADLELLRTSDFPNLSEIDISANPLITHKSIRSLLQALTALRCLAVEGNSLIDKETLKLAFPKWRFDSLVSFKDWKKRGEGLSKFLTTLISGKRDWLEWTLLDLSQQNITDEDFKWVLEARWKALKSLDLSQNPLGYYGLLSLAQGRFGKLTDLNLSGITLASETWDKLSLSLQFLSILNLSNTGFNEPHAQNMAQGIWSKLQSLDLSQNPLDRNGVKLLTSGSYPCLTSLILNHTNINPWEDFDILNQLKKYFPTIRSFNQPVLNTEEE